MFISKILSKRLFSSVKKIRNIAFFRITFSPLMPIIKGEITVKPNKLLISYSQICIRGKDEKLYWQIEVPSSTRSLKGAHTV